MRTKFASALIIVATLGLSGVAMASQNDTSTDTGFIRSVNVPAKTVTLWDGITYQMPAAADLHQVEQSRVIKVEWAQAGGARVVQSFSLSN